MAKRSAELLMERETRVSHGRVPDRLLTAPVDQMCWQMEPDQFLLRAEGDHYFHYRRGRGVTIHRGDDADPSEESLWLNGSVYAAIASMNGLLPIHASAVAVDGLVFAFTGAAGVGKSTLVAALGRYGFPMFCDDTLVMDLTDPDRIICLPGHKRLKLRDDAFALTGARRQESVSRTSDKDYAVSAAGTMDVALPFGELIFLEQGPAPRIEEIFGSERFRRLEDDHYTSKLFEAASKLNRAEQFEHRARLARQIPMARFERPLDPSRFDECIALIAEYCKSRHRMTA